MELEKERQLPFLNVLVKRTQYGLTTSVYRKPTHTDRYLNFKSHHHPKMKVGIIKCLAHRAREVSHPDSFQTELQHLQQVFESNDYPAPLVRRCLGKKRTDPAETQSSDDKPKFLCLPYIKGLSESIERGCKQQNTKLASSDPREHSTAYSPESRTNLQKKR